MSEPPRHSDIVEWLFKGRRLHELCKSVGAYHGGTHDNQNAQIILSYDTDEEAAEAWVADGVMAKILAFGEDGLHPMAVEAAVRLLTRHGWTVLPPTPIQSSALPPNPC